MIGLLLLPDMRVRSPVDLLECSPWAWRNEFGEMMDPSDSMAMILELMTSSITAALENASKVVSTAAPRKRSKAQIFILLEMSSDNPTLWCDSAEATLKVILSFNAAACTVGSDRNS